MSMLQAIGLSVFPNVGGWLGGYFYTRTEVKNWYEPILKKPSWRPPSWVFAPVWTTLYTSMGYASFLVLRDGVGESRKLALGLYASQLALNWAWTPIFFGWKKLGLATAEIALMVATTAATVYSFYPINKTAAYLMLPYLAWITFATALTFNVWQNNPKPKSN